jgi:hypothetical protein
MQVTHRQQSSCRVNEVTAYRGWGAAAGAVLLAQGKVTAVLEYLSSGRLMEIARMSLQITDQGRIVREVMGDDMDDFAFALQHAIDAQHS